MWLVAAANQEVHDTSMMEDDKKRINARYPFRRTRHHAMCFTCIIIPRQRELSPRNADYIAYTFRIHTRISN